MNTPFRTISPVFAVLFTLSFLFFSADKVVFAEEKITPGKFVVSFTAEDEQKYWVVTALEENIYNDMSGYERVTPLKKSVEKENKCKNRNTDCILNIYRHLKADALMLGSVNKTKIEYEVYDVQNKSLVNTGTIPLGAGSSLLKLRLGAFNAFKAFIEKGGILDKRKFKSSEITNVSTKENGSGEKPAADELKQQIVIFLAAFTCLPYLLSFLSRARRHPERRKIITRWFYPFLLVTLPVLGYQYVLELAGKDSIVSLGIGLLEGYQWVLTGLGGIAWGLFIVLNIRIVIPNLQGIERIRPNILWPLIKSSLMTMLVKSMLVISYYAMFFYGVFHAAMLFAIDQNIIITLLIPFAGLYLIYWTALMLDVFSMAIDVKLTGGDLDYSNVWNLKIRKYFIANLKRNGVSLNKFLVEDVVFLPGQNRGVVCYGGGFSRPRITIDKELIKFALGDVDDFNPEATIVYTRKEFDKVLRQHSLFRILANLAEAQKKKILFKGAYDRKRIKRIETVQKFFTRDLTAARITAEERNENIMLGRVIPRLDAEQEPLGLMSDNIDDMEIIEALLNENAIKFIYDPDAEVDDASEMDKDFLFGAILNKFGELLRHEDVYTTGYFYLFYSPRTRDKKKTYNFFFSKHFAIVADTFVVLNFGLNHLMQYLHYQSTKNPAFLTQKGVPDRMLESQADILSNAKEAADKRKPYLVRTDELERIVWLSKFCQEPVQLQKGLRNKLKILFKWSVSLGAIYLASLVLVNSYEYHPRYLEIIEQEKQEIAEAIEKKLEKEGNKHEQQ